MQFCLKTEVTAYDDDAAFAKQKRLQKDDAVVWNRSDWMMMLMILLFFETETIAYDDAAVLKQKWLHMMILGKLPKSGKLEKSKIIITFWNQF